jgi:hypothetical protein
MTRYVPLIVGMMLGATAVRGAGAAPPVPSQDQESTAAEAASAERFDVELLGDQAPQWSPICGSFQPVADGPAGHAAFEVAEQQYGFSIPGPVFVGPDTTVQWSWKKTAGKVCILQLGLVNPETGARRYLGYGAGEWSEPPAADPTVEIFVSGQMPRQWTTVRRRLADDIKSALGWRTAQVTEAYLSPWDGERGWFAQATIGDAYSIDIATGQGKTGLAFLSWIGQGRYVPPRLKKLDEPRELKFDTPFEELAPGRNSAANEWSAYGVADGHNAFNNFGRDLRVRYPAFDLVFRLYDAERELAPGDLKSFRLGLVRGNLPAIWAGWRFAGLRYKVSVMAVPFGAQGAFDLFKLEIQNPTTGPLESKLVAGLDGPPDMRLEGDVARGLGDAPFLLAEPPGPNSLLTREWGLCDKRAKAYGCGGGPGKTEEAVSSTRIGLDGLPVVYRVKAEPGAKYLVYLVASPHLSGLLEHPRKSGDLVFKYEVEGAAPQTLDWNDYLARKSQPLCARFDGAHDTDGDGYLQIVAGCAENSRIKHTRLSAIYVFPEGTKVDDVSAVYSGALNDRCLRHIDVGITPECGAANQLYDQSDVGLCRLKLACGATIAPGETKTCWLKVPPIHRRQPASMGSVSHAFLEVLPGEAVPPFGAAQLAELRGADPQRAWQSSADSWDRFFARAARIETPDPILQDIYLSRLATRAILDVKIGGDAWFNACSPWFYYDFAYRDQAYVVYAYDLAGLHDLAARLLRVYCMDAKDVPPGPIAFGEKPLQLGMAPDGVWLTRPGQFDAQGQNLWCLVEHYKLSGDRPWLTEIAYPYIRRGAQWIINSRHRHIAEVKDPNDPRYGLIEPGAMEVATMGKGMHHYYMDAWAVLGLREAAEAAGALRLTEEQELFAREAQDLQSSLLKSFRQTFKRTGLYQGHIWFGVEPQGEGMYGFWGHTPLLWPTRSIDPHDPMLTGTFRLMERMAHDWGGDMNSESPGGCWPYIGVDWAISYLLRGEPEKTLDYFCAFTDTAGQTLSWGEGYENARNVAAGDQPHFWADAQWLNLYRHLFVMEDGASLSLTPATLRRWQGGDAPIRLQRLPTEFGNLDLTIQPHPEAKQIDYRFRLAPQGDQSERLLERIVVNARTPGGQPVGLVELDGKPWPYLIGQSVVLPRPERNKEYHLRFRSQ